MNSSFHFINQNLIFPIFVIGVLLLLVFVWKEWEGNFNSSFIFRTVIGLIALISIGMMVLRPTILKEQSRKGLLLTNGYNKIKLDSLKKKIPGLKTMVYQKGRSVKRELDSIGEVFVLGEGIPSFDFWQLDGHPVCFMDNELPEGIIKLKYRQELIEGEVLQVKGLYHKSKVGNQLVLQGPGGGGLDSVVLENHNQRAFELNTISKVSGKFLFQLVEKDSLGKTVSSEPLPVVVNDKEFLKILIINEFPSFETKYLKNFLTETGHELVVRSQITKRKYKFEYFNTDKKPIYKFASESLKDFDLLILDADSYLGLSKNSKEAIVTASRENGLGVFVQPDEKLFKRQDIFKEATIILPNNNTIVTGIQSEVKIKKYPYRFSFNNNLSGKPINDHSFYEFNGLGKIGTTLLKNTYELVLDGSSKQYHNIWSQIINQLGRKKQKSGLLKSSELFAFQNQPYRLELKTAEEDPVISHNDGYKISMMQNLGNPNSWHATTYPLKLGWNTIKTELDSTIFHDYYVMDTIQWVSLISAKIKGDNLRNFDKINGVSNEVKIREPISRIGFFLCFLVAMGLLWLMPKLKG